MAMRARRVRYVGFGAAALILNLFAGGQARAEDDAQGAKGSHATSGAKCPALTHGVKVVVTDGLTLSARCKGLVLKHNAACSLADAEKDNDDDDDDDDGKVHAAATRIESQEAAAQAHVEKMLDEVEDATEELEKAEGTSELEAKAQAVEDAIDDYDAAVETAAKLAKAIANRSKREIRGSISKHKSSLESLKHRLKSAKGDEKERIEEAINDEEGDSTEKEELLAKVEYHDARQQHKIVSHKLGAGKKKQLSGLLTTFNNAKGAYKKVKALTDGKLAKHKTTGQSIVGRIAKSGNKALPISKSVKAKAAHLGSIFKHLAGQVKNTADGVNDGVNEVKSGIATGKSLVKNIKKGDVKAVVKNVKHAAKTIKNAINTGKSIVKSLGSLFG